MTTELAEIVIEDQVTNVLGDPETAMAFYREGVTIQLLTQSEHYARQLLTYVIEFIEEHGVAPSKEVLVTEFGNEYSFHEPSVPVGHLVKLMRERYTNIVIQGSIERIARAVKTDPLGAVRLGLAELSEISENTKTTSDVIYISDWREQLAEYEQKRESGALTGVTMGYPEMDTRLGGLKGLSFVLGRPKRFKSWMLLNSAIEAMKQGLRPVFFSLEMPKEEMYSRACCLLTDTSAFRRDNAGGWLERDIERYRRQMEEEFHDVWNMPIISPRLADRTVPGLLQIAAREEADIIYIDQFKFVQPHRSLEAKKWERAEYICEDLKLATTDGVPICIAAQFNREASKLSEMGDASQIGISDAIPQTADLLLGCHQTKDMRSSFMMEFGTVEARHAGAGRWYIGIDLFENCNLKLIEEVVD